LRLSVILSISAAMTAHLLDEAQHSGIGDLFSNKSREFVLIDRPKIVLVLHAVRGKKK
jgi:hypothetical protein